MAKPAATLVLISGFLMLSTLSVLTMTSTAEQGTIPPASPPSPANAIPDPAQLSFERNVGQWDDAALYRIKAADVSAFLTPTELVFQMGPSPSHLFPHLLPRHPPAAVAVTVRVRFENANPSAVMEGQTLPFVSNHLIGSGPEQWVSNVPHVDGVTLENLYPGIDLVLHGDDGGRLKVDFAVRPGADPDAIRLKVLGADTVAIDGDGSLRIHTLLGDIVQAPPLSYQDNPVPSAWTMQSPTEARFSIGPYDPTLPLVIDPLVYSTYVGGSGNDVARAVAADSSGNIFIVGETDSTNYPTTTGAYLTSAPALTNAFVSKLNATAMSLIYSTYLGGSAADAAYAVAVDASGNAYVTGRTQSTNFPTTAGAFDTAITSGTKAAFVSKLNAAGNGLTFSTFLGNDGGDVQAYDVAIDDSGYAYLTGHTTTGSLPTTAGAYQAVAPGGGDAFLSKLNPTGSGLQFSTYFGGSAGDETGYGLSDIANVFFLVGSTTSSNFPTTAGALQASLGGSSDAFIGRFSSFSTSGTPSNSTFLGGTGADRATAVAMIGSGRIFVTGDTSSSNFPVTAGAAQTVRAGGKDAFVARVSSFADQLIYSSYLGGSADDSGNAIATDGIRAFVAGQTASTNYPVTPGTVQAAFGGGASDATLTGLSESGDHIAFSTFLGGSGDDSALGAARTGTSCCSNRDWFVVGSSTSNNFPTTAGAFQVVKAGGTDAFAVKIQTPDVPWNVQNPASACGNPVGVLLSWSPPSYDGGSPITGYAIRREISGPRIATVTTTSYTDVPPFQTSEYQYVVSAENLIGESGGVAGPSLRRTPCDSQPPTVTGSPGAWPWRSTIPSLDTVSFTDAYSGLDTTAQYSVGTISGGTGVAPWTTMPVQPTLGSTSPWAPTWSPSALAQGTNYVNVQITDQKGTLGTFNGAYEIQFDTTAPINTSPALTVWTNTPNPTVSGVGFQDPLSGLANDATYWVGSAQGASDYLGATILPVQPAVGETSTWAPSFQIASGALRLGDNHVTIRVTDRAGNSADIPSYLIRYETAAPTVSGNPVSYAWTNVTPTLAGVTWEDAHSGLAANAQYSVGTTSGATNVVGWTTLAVGQQPTIGQTTPWNPSFTPSSLAQGTNYVNMLVTDVAGNTRQTDGAYVVEYETGPATPSGNPQAMSWQNTAPTVSGVSWTDTLSGLAPTAEYSVGTTSGATNIQGWTTMPVQPTNGQKTAWTPTWAPAQLGQGLNHVNIRIRDVAGTLATTNGAYTIEFDTANPTMSGAPVVTAWSNANPILTGVCHQDGVAGLANNAVYWVGSIPGADDYLASTSMPTQPTPGQTANWCPSFQVAAAAVHTGSNFVTIRVTDRAGNTKTTQAFELRYDDVAENLGLPEARTNSGGSLLPASVWQNDATPYFSWTPPTSVSPIAGYSYTISTSSSTNPDTIAETSNAFADYAASPRFDSTWYFKVRSVDQAGNWGPTSAAFVLKVDASPPTTPTLSSGTHPVVTEYYNRTTVTVTWSTTDPLSGIDGYSYALVPGLNPPSLDNVKEVEETTTTATFTDVGPFGVYTFGVKARDNTGNWGLAGTRTIRVDAVAPSIEGLEPEPDLVSADPRQHVLVNYGDPDGGLDISHPKVTPVDISTVKLFVDGIDVISQWSSLCGPGGPLHGSACTVEVSENQVFYEPLNPWSEGPHELFVTLQDRVQDANTANAAWNFTSYSGEGTDTDFDRVPDAMEALLCGRDLIADTINLVGVLGQCEAADSFRPPQTHQTFFAPLDAIPGPDADEDGFPAYVRIRGLDVSVHPFQVGLTRAAPAEDRIQDVDPNDADPNDPLSTTVGPIPVPIGASDDGDADNDYVPHEVTIEWLDVSVDRTQDPPIILGAHTTSAILDGNDGDRDDQSVVSVPFSSVDFDNDVVPDALEPVVCRLQDASMPDDGMCVRSDGTGVDGSGDNYVPPMDAPNPWNLS